MTAIGVEFGSRIVEIKEGDDAGKRIKLQIWDTAGQVRCVALRCFALLVWGWLTAGGVELKNEI